MIWGLFPVGGALVGAPLTVGLLRWHASVRSRELPQVVESADASWAALARVMADGHFLDQQRNRRHGGPRGTLLAISDSLEWQPDAYELKHGDVIYRWPLDQVHVLDRRSRRDITGLTLRYLTLQPPSGRVTFGIFHTVGTEPEPLSLPEPA